nr:glycine-rich RNA-binding protein-like [Procambarus clarkii]
MNLEQDRSTLFSDIPSISEILCFLPERFTNQVTDSTGTSPVSCKPGCDCQQVYKSSRYLQGPQNSSEFRGINITIRHVGEVLMVVMALGVLLGTTDADPGYLGGYGGGFYRTGFGGGYGGRYGGGYGAGYGGYGGGYGHGK